jgi:hypothetical protein
MTFLNHRENVGLQHPKVRFLASTESAMIRASFAFCTASTRMWKAAKKSVWPHLTYFCLIVRLQMVRHSLKVWDRAGDSQSGLKYSKEQIL